MDKLKTYNIESDIEKMYDYDDKTRIEKQSYFNGTYENVINLIKKEISEMKK